MNRRSLLKGSLAAGVLLPMTNSTYSLVEPEVDLLHRHSKAAAVVKRGPLINFEQAYKVMHQENLDGLIVSEPTNLFYLTGYYDHLGFRFDSPTMFALLSKDENKPVSIVMNQFIYYFCVADSNFAWRPDVFLFTGWDQPAEKGLASLGRLEPKASAPVTWRNKNEVPISELELNRLRNLTKTLDAIPESADINWALSKAIRSLDLQKATVGIDNSVIKHSIDSLGLNTKTVEGEHALRKIKVIKSEREIELMRYAAQNNAEAALAAVKHVRAGASYHDLKAIYFGECADRGCAPKLLQINTVNSEIFNNDFKDGDAFAIDGVSQHFHYTGDYGRTIFLGEPSKSMKRATEAISIGWDAVREAIRPGVRYSEIRSLGRDAIKKAGYDFGVPVTPHSVGLSHTDEPGKNGPGALWQKDDLVLQENMVISVDLPVLNTGIGGSAHLEDLTLITKDGGEQINDVGDRIVIV